MWGEVTPDRGAARELELADHFFKRALNQGARMVRHLNTTNSAQEILLHLVHNVPIPLQIQKELVDENKDISETAAGQELLQEQKELMEKHAAQMADIQQELEEAMAEGDEQAKEELEQARKELEENIRKVEHDRDRLSLEYSAQKQEASSRVREVMEIVQRGEKERLEGEAQLQWLRREMAKRSRASQAEQQAMLHEIQSLRAQRNGSRGRGHLSIQYLLEMFLAPFQMLGAGRPAGR